MDNYEPTTTSEKVKRTSKEEEFEKMIENQKQFMDYLHP